MPRKSLVHYIAPSAISITPNCNESANDLAVSLVRGAKIKVFSPAVGLETEDGYFQEWTLYGRNRRLADSAGNDGHRYTIYARLSKANKDGGYLVFAQMTKDEDDEWVDKYWHVTSKGYSRRDDNRLDEDFDPDDPPQTDEDEKKMQKNNWWFRLGEVSEPSGGQRTVTLDTGILGTDQFNTEWNLVQEGLHVDLTCRLLEPYTPDPEGEVPEPEGEDAGPTPYVPWGYWLRMQAELAGMRDDEVVEVKKWEITRSTGAGSIDWLDDEDPRREYFEKEGKIILSHTRGEEGTDDFEAAVSLVFTVTAWGTKRERTDKDDEEEEQEPVVVVQDGDEGEEGDDGEILAMATITIMSETNEQYALQLSETIVNYDEENGFSPEKVFAHVRSTDQRTAVTDITTEQMTTARLSVEYALANDLDTWIPLTFADSDPTDPDDPDYPNLVARAFIGGGGDDSVFYKGENIIVRLIETLQQKGEDGQTSTVIKELSRKTILNYYNLGTKYVTVGFFKKLFAVHHITTESGQPEDKVIETNKFIDDEDTTVNIEAKRGIWSPSYVSALGQGSGEGGGGAALEWPLQDINVADMPRNPKAGDTIVWDGTTFSWGKSGGGLKGLHLYDGATPIPPTISGDNYSFDLGQSFLSLTRGGTVSGNVTINGANLAITNGTLTISHPQGFNPLQAADNVVLTKKETETVFDERYVTVNWFKKLFEAREQDGTEVKPNEDGPINNLKVLVGTWTQQYLSALGIGSDGGSGGVWYLNLLEDVDHSKDPQNNDTLIWDGSQWTFGTAGLDTNELNRILQGKTLTIKDGTTSLGSWNPSQPGEVDISAILTGKKWWGRSLEGGQVKGSLDDVGNITPDNAGTYSIGTSQKCFGAIYVNEIYIGDAKISWDDINRGVHLSKAVYSDEWVSALGTGSGGGGGTPLDDLLMSLNGAPLSPTSTGYTNAVLVCTNGSWSWKAYNAGGGGGGDIGDLQSLTVFGGNTTAVAYNPGGSAQSLTVNGKENEISVTVPQSTTSIQIALADNYGDTKNPYAAKAANKVLAGPTSGSDAQPTFRDLGWADIKTGKPTSWWGQSTIDENGAVKGHIQYTGSITPEISDQYTLGNSELRYDKAYVKELWIGGVQVNVENGGLHIHQAGLYADTYVSSLGTGSGGGGGTPLNDLLMSMNGASIVPGTQTNQVIVYNGNGSWSFQPYNSGGGGGGGSISNVSLWGNAFNGTQNVDGNICFGDNSGNDGYISGCSNIDSALYFIKSNNTISQVNVGSSTAATFTNGSGNTVTPKLYVGGNIGTSSNVFAHGVDLYAANPYIDFHCGSSDNDYTTRFMEYESKTSSNTHDHYYLKLFARNSEKTGLVVGSGQHGDYIKIGDATIYWDYNNQGLHIDKGIYSDSFVSSLGTGSGGSSGGGGADLSDVWDSLTTNTDPYKNFKIDNNHLSFDTNFGSMAKETASDYVKNEDLGTLTITVGSTTKTWKATQNETIEISGGDSPYTLPAASSGALGGIKIGYSQDDTNKRYPVKLSDEKAYVEVPWEDKMDTVGINKIGVYDSEIYLVGTKAEPNSIAGSDYATSFESSTCYIKENCLYSNGSKVLTSALALGELSNVTISSPTAGQALVYRNGGWLNETISASVPLAASGTRGGIKIGYSQDDTNKRYPVKLSSDEKAYVEVPWEDNNTKDTAGNSQSNNTQLYLIAGSSSNSQNSSTKTYTNSMCYIGTDNCLYSNGSKVLTSALALGDLSNVTINNPTAGQALVYRNGGWLNETISASVPLAASGTRGGIKIGYSQDDTNKRYPVKLSSDEKAYVEVPWEDNNTKDTAGNSQSNNTQLYLIAGSSSTSQNSSTKTYTNSMCYIGTDNCLYSNGSKVQTEASGYLPNTGGTMTGAITMNSLSTGYSMDLKHGGDSFGFYSNTNSDWIFYYNQNTKRAHFGSKLNLCNLFGTNVVLYGINSGTEKEGLRVTKAGDVRILNRASVGTDPDDNYTLKVGGKGYFTDNLTVASGKKIYIGSNEVLTTGNTVSTDTEQIISGQKTFSGNLLAKKIQMTASNAATYLEHTKLYSPNATMTIQGSDSAQNLTLCTGGGNVGIGVAADNNYKLKVSGATLFDGRVGIGGLNSETATKLYVSGKATITGDFYAATDFMIRKVTNPDNSYYYTIGINQKTVSAQGTWQGTFTSGSDIRQKDVIQNREISLEDIARTPIFEFTWKDRRDTKVHLGTSAQYIDSILPSVVYGQHEDSLSMDYGATALAYAVTTARTVLSHEEQIAALKRRVDDVEQENKWLRQEIELLKAA